jgi:hypothetical protein
MTKFDVRSSGVLEVILNTGYRQGALLDRGRGCGCKTFRGIFVGLVRVCVGG